ncbi:IclR family transcriptional regulator [Afifella sp. YEN Y35]|uniref:IclR family transcriptional regulator n=1 Tax=Afifella sp. YEN Y35 TaxID=3388337 RepID=UPI0039E1E524
MSTQGQKGRKTNPLMVQSVAKAFRVLQAFDSKHPSMSLSEIAEQTDMDLSAAQRFAYTLQHLGYLTKNPVTRQFSLALKTLDLGYNYRQSSELVGRAMPVLQHLSKQTEETVNLTILDGTEIVYIARIQSRHVLNADVTTGTRLPAYCMSPGRAILSQMSEEDVRAVIAKSDLQMHTPATVTDPDRLMELIAEVRVQGYAVCFEELYRGDASIAAPIIGPGDKVTGAVSIATSLARFSPEEVTENYANLIIAAGRSISIP